MSYRITYTCFSADASCAQAVRNWRWNWRRKATDGWNRSMSGANASPIGRSHQERSHREHDDRRTQCLRHSVLLDKGAVAGQFLALGGAAQEEGNGRLPRARLSVDQAGELEVHKRGSNSTDHVRTGKR